MSLNNYCNIYHADKRGLIARRVKFARGFFSRLRGLLGCKQLEEGEGLLLYPCSAIHCFGMQFPIDAIFLDHQNRVLCIHENMLPGSKASDHRASMVLELNAGEALKHGIEKGEELLISFNDKKK
jgi:hypothetical protein